MGDLMDDLVATSAKSIHLRSWLALTSLVVTHAVLNVLFNPFKGFNRNLPEWVGFIVMGVMLAQPIMFAAWCVLGPPPLIKRVPLTIATLAGLLMCRYLIKWDLLTGSSKERSDAGMLVLPAAIFAGGIVVMTIVRAIARWRIDTAIEEPASAATLNQFTMKYLLVLTTLCAILLGIGRTISVDSWFPGTGTRNFVVEFLMMSGILLLATLPGLFIPLAVLSARPPMRVLVALPFAWLALTWLAVECIVASQKEDRWEVFGDIGLIQLGAVAIGVFSAVVLRMGGYRLFRQAKRGLSASAQAV
jgi:hypothetical protein